mgnify:CR=1 FL=1|tara:strand:- start:107 stop:427 length:321 start_codon:yes stop_codon:yes gene_type:complete
MKKLYILLLLLFQSCFSYKYVNFNDIKNKKQQKIEITYLDKTNVKGRLVFIDKNKIILQNKEQNQTILKDEIYDLKVRKFSILKLAVVGFSTYGALVIIALASFSL